MLSGTLLNRGWRMTTIGGRTGTPATSLSQRFPKSTGLQAEIPSIGFDLFVRGATKKAAGSSNNGRKPNAKYRGPKKTQGETVVPGNILVKQLGNRFHPGRGVRMASDFTLYAKEAGYVRYSYNNHKKRSFVHVETPERYEEIAKIHAYDRARRSKDGRKKVWPFFLPAPSQTYLLELERQKKAKELEELKKIQRKKQLDALLKAEQEVMASSQ